MAVKRNASVMIIALGAVTLVGCAHQGGAQPYDKPSGLHLLGGHAKSVPTPAIGVNGYLWRASLDTLAFMPLTSADPYGGIIITDWYINPEKTAERFKCTVYILDTRLRADGLNVTVFKQVKDPTGGWTDAPVADQTASDIENAILTRARQIRLSNVSN
jgi:hypothetical protein